MFQIRDISYDLNFLLNQENKKVTDSNVIFHNIQDRHYLRLSERAFVSLIPTTFDICACG